MVTMRITKFSDKTDPTPHGMELSWPELVDMLKEPAVYQSINGMPLLKMATFTGNRSNETMATISGIEGDYDGQVVQPKAAYECLASVGIKAFIYTTRRSTLSKPRWRVLCPLSEELDASERTRLMERLNGALNGILAPESFTLSQSYFFGRVEGQAYHWFDTDDDGGMACIDERCFDYIQPIAKRADVVDITTGEPLGAVGGMRGIESLVDRLGRKLTTGDGKRDLLRDVIVHNRKLGCNADELWAIVQSVSDRFFDDGYDPGDVSGMIEWAFQACELDDNELSLDDFQDLPGTPAKQHPLEKLWTGDAFRKPTYLIDGVITDKLSLLAAFPGKGKTTALTMLACIASGAISVEGMTVDAPRRVIFVSEHPEQVALMIVCIAKHFDLDHNDILRRILLVDAVKMRPETLIKADWASHGVQHTINGVTRTLLPWVILDTHSATIVMDNENDNAEGGKVMAAIKQGLVTRGYPVTICAHTSKAHKHGKAEDMTTRGASAFEGDANQIIYLSADDDDNRFIEIAAGKHRFTHKAHSLQLNAHIDTIELVDEWGRRCAEDVLWTELSVLDGRDREAIEDLAEASKAERVERAKQDRRSDIELRIVNFLRGKVDVSTSTITAAISGKKTTVLEVLSAMLESGKIRLTFSGRAKLYTLEGTIDENCPF